VRSPAKHRFRLATIILVPPGRILVRTNFRPRAPNTEKAHELGIALAVAIQDKTRAVNPIERPESLYLIEVILDK
jgi:hypothetical protein